MKKSFYCATILFSLLFFSQAPMAGDDPVSTMANIMMHLEHYPSDSEKKMLKDISMSSTASKNQKSLATAMINLQHKVSAGDKPALNAIMSDGNASSGEKTLAKVILNLKHMPSSADKTELQKLVK